MPGSPHNAAVVGAGPNGLAGAITLAQAGMAVTVYEAEAIAGGAARTLELTLPGFRHDFGSAVHPMAAGSPFFRKLPLAAYGLEWIYSPAAMAHPLDDGTAVLLVRDLDEQCRILGDDGTRMAPHPGATIGPLVVAEPGHPAASLLSAAASAASGPNGSLRRIAGINAGAAGISGGTRACALRGAGGALVSEPDATFQ